MTTDSCSYNTPGSINGWHSPDNSSSSYHNGAISKNTSYFNGYTEKDIIHEKEFRNDEGSSKNIYDLTNGLTNGVKNINICNGITNKAVQGQQNCNENDMNSHKKGL